MKTRSEQHSASDRRLRSVEQLAPRHSASIRLANQWLDSHRTTQEELALLMGVERSALNRYLNEHPDYRPAATRPQMMKILEGIERVCSSHYDIVEIEPTPPKRAPGWEDEALYQFHLKLNHELRRKVEPEAMGSSAAVIVSMAVHGPMKFRSRMCANACVTIASSLEKVAAEAVTERSLRECAEWLLRLERAGLDAIASCENALVRDRIINATGCGIGHAGAILDDDKLIDAGATRLIESSCRSQEEDDGFWTDTLGFIERLFTVSSPSADRWSKAVADACRAHPSPSLWFTLRTRSLPMTWSHWRRAAPELLSMRSPFERKDA
ncbi:MAG TPA: hypothetical protein VG797_03470 [Phycisphaerales bacterium]|nr:hypothetical protein [Phycisphaerales bacterium]